jgi:septum formation protein
VFHTEKEFILASQSPRRRMFLEALGIGFRVTAASIDEIIEDQESPQTFVERMAFEKAMDVSRQHQAAWVLSADTIVYIDDKVFGKPGSKKEAVEMLMILSGREHNVMTGYCLACTELNIIIVERVCTSVRFASFTEDIAHAYVQTGEPLDKAGSYGIQGKGGALVETISGSYSNVVGLPLVETLALLQRFKVISAV